MSEEEKSRTQPFLSRWSQLKRETQVEAEGAHDSHVSQQVNEIPVSPPKESQPLPDIDSLDEHSDYSAFLSPDVSEDLQRMALRKLFTSARFNVRDGLDDYDEDYRSFHSLGDTVTAEMRHRLERERERLGTNEETEPLETPVVQQEHTEAAEQDTHDQSLDEPDDSGTA